MQQPCLLCMAAARFVARILERPSAHAMFSSAAAAHDARALTPVASAQARSGDGVDGRVQRRRHAGAAVAVRNDGAAVSSAWSIDQLGRDGAPLDVWRLGGIDRADSHAARRIDTPLTAPWLALLAAMAVAAAVAPAYRANALHMVGRLDAGVRRVPRRGEWRDQPRPVRACCCWRSRSQDARWRRWSSWTSSTSRRRAAFLELFHSQTATIGAQVRASGPFQYPTIASMFLEIAFAVAVGAAAAGD